MANEEKQVDTEELNTVVASVVHQMQEIRLTYTEALASAVLTYCRDNNLDPRDLVLVEHPRADNHIEWFFTTRAEIEAAQRPPKLIVPDFRAKINNKREGD